MENQGLSFTEQDFIGQEKTDRRKNMAGALAGWLNSMSINPDPNLPQVLQAAQSRRADKIKGNRTVNMLEEAGRTDLADMVKAGTLDPKQAAAQLFAEAGERRAFERQKQLADYKFGLERQLSAAKPTKVSAAENKIQRLMETGLDRTTAIAIADGRLTTSQDPITGQVQLIDKGTGNVIAPSVPQSVVAEVETVGAATEGQFEGLDPTLATGARGWANFYLNKVTDAIGAGQVAGEAGEVAEAMNVLKLETLALADTQFAGKPTNFIRERVEEFLTISPSDIGTGPDAARKKADKVIDMLQRTLNNADAISKDSTAPAATRRSAQSSLQPVKDLLGQYQSLKNAIDSKLNPAPSLAVDPVEIDLMNSLLQQDGLQ
jgi:hypothetical protein